MDFENEIKKLENLKLKEDNRKIPAATTYYPSILKSINDEAKRQRLSRGDLLTACFLRLYELEEILITKTTTLAEEEKLAEEEFNKFRN